MTTWLLTLRDSEDERVQAQGVGVTNDGSLIFSDGPNNIVAVYNVHHWLKVVPSPVQIARTN